MIVRSKYPDLIRVGAAEPLTGFTVRVTFTDGSKRDINLEPYLYGPVFDPIRNDPEMFRRLIVDEGALAWPNGADIDPDTLYYDGSPPWAKDEGVKVKGERDKKKTSAQRRAPGRRTTARARAD